MVNGKDIEIEIINRIISKDYFLISKVKERIRKRYERKRINIEKLLTLGYTTSGDPWKIGTK